jgi:hypothetical protein
MPHYSIAEPEQELDFLLYSARNSLITDVAVASPSHRQERGVAGPSIQQPASKVSIK